MLEQQSSEENKAVEWEVKKWDGWIAGEIWQESKKSENSWKKPQKNVAQCY